MESPLVGGALAFLLGCAVSALNFWINLRTLRKKPSALASMSTVRQLLNVGCLAAAFFLGKVLPWGTTPVLVGAALGLTVPAVLFSMKLAKINDSLPAEAGTSSEKGADTDE